jgi:aldehyde:ferredoxin oxidoreductase
MNPTVDPLGPENKLIFATGPLTGTNASCGARYMVITKGALTNAITTSNSGGHWGPELKFAGYDMVILEGRADRPCYLWIYDENVEIRSADHLWGKNVWETEDLIREELGIPDTIVASIGPAGESGPLRGRGSHGVQKPEGHCRTWDQGSPDCRPRGLYEVHVGNEG